MLYDTLWRDSSLFFHKLRRLFDALLPALIYTVLELRFPT